MGYREPPRRLTWRHLLVDVFALITLTLVVALAVVWLQRDIRRSAAARAQIETNARWVCKDPECRCHHYHQATPHEHPQDDRD